MLVNKIIEIFCNRTFIKFLIVWWSSTIINYWIFYITLNYLFIDYLISSLVWYISWLIFWYFLNKFRTYNNNEKHSIKIIINYITVYIFWLALNLFILKISVDYLQIMPEIWNLIAIWFSTISNYLWTKFLVFNQSNVERFDKK